MIRDEVSHLKKEDIKKLDDDDIIDAILIPDSSKRAKKIFRFLLSNSNLITSIGSMSVVVTGVDRYKLSILAKGYGIDLFRYMDFVDMFEDFLVKDYNKSLKKSK